MSFTSFFALVTVIVTFLASCSSPIQSETASYDIANRTAEVGPEEGPIREVPFVQILWSYSDVFYHPTDTTTRTIGECWYSYLTDAQTLLRPQEEIVQRLLIESVPWTPTTGLVLQNGKLVQTEDADPQLPKATHLFIRSDFLDSQFHQELVEKPRAALRDGTLSAGATVVGTYLLRGAPRWIASKGASAFVTSQRIQAVGWKGLSRAARMGLNAARKRPWTATKSLFKHSFQMANRVFWPMFTASVAYNIARWSPDQISARIQRDQTLDANAAWGSLLGTSYVDALSVDERVPLVAAAQDMSQRQRQQYVKQMKRLGKAAVEPLLRNARETPRLSASQMLLSGSRTLQPNAEVIDIFSDVLFRAYQREHMANAFIGQECFKLSELKAFDNKQK